MSVGNSCYNHLYMYMYIYMHVHIIIASWTHMQRT